MAIYGQRKTGLLSSFAVFQDENSKSKSKQDSQKQTRRTKSKVLGTKLPPQSRSDDESIDELDGEALLPSVPKQITRVDSLHQELSLSRPNSSRSYQTAGEGADRSPSPSASISNQSIQDNTSRPALALRTANLRLLDNRVSSNASSKSGRSTLVHQPSKPAATKRPATSHTAESLPLSHPQPNDPVELSRKISSLMRQAETQEAESRVKASILATELAKASPRQRAKQAIVKASRTIKGKLSNGHADMSSPSEPPRLYDATSGPTKPRIEYNKQDRAHFARRIAEGMNLSNPKVQSLMGSGNAPQKYLPVYESMRSRAKRSSIEDDPFLDAPETFPNAVGKDSSVSVHDFSGFDFSFDKGGEDIDTRKSGNEGKNKRAGQPTRFLPGSQSMPNFIHGVSGLTQHSDTMYFSSSPDATSTPPSKLLMRRIEGPGKRNKAHKALKRQSSSESGSDKEDYTNPSPASKTATEGSQSVKRKSAQECLRASDTPASKKAKTASQFPLEDTGNLTDGFNNLGTHDNKHAASSPSVRGSVEISPLQPKSRNKGLGIFDVGKGKGVERKTEEQPLITKKSRPKGFTVRRASFPRPNSMMFGRESRTTGNGKFKKLDDDDMDVDELA